MSEPARDADDADFTPAERAELRRILRAVKRDQHERVDGRARRGVVRDREPPPEAFERVLRRRKRRGGDGS